MLRKADELAQREATTPERWLACGVHVSSIFFPIWGPVVAFFICRKRHVFAATHALQSLFETITLNVCIFLVGTASFIYTVTRLWGYYQNHWEGINVWEFVIKFAVGWLLLTVLGIINTIISIVQASKALGGQWPKRGKWAKRLLKA